MTFTSMLRLSRTSILKHASTRCSTHSAISFDWTVASLVQSRQKKKPGLREFHKFCTFSVRTACSITRDEKSTQHPHIPGRVIVVYGGRIVSLWERVCVQTRVYSAISAATRLRREAAPFSRDSRTTRG